MLEDKLQAWLEAYGRAWETNNSAGFVALFIDNATYIENPFDDPLVGAARPSASGGTPTQVLRSRPDTPWPALRAIAHVDACCDRISE